MPARSRLHERASRCLALIDMQIALHHEDVILNQVRVHQTVDGDDKAYFLKELVMTRFRSDDGEVPLALVRKRAADLESTRAPILLIHGYGQNRYAWHLPARSFSNYLARAGFDVFNLDLRGHGRSRHLGARRPADVAEFAREDIPCAIEEIKRQSEGRPVFLIGHSLGGLVSYAAGPSLGADLAGIVSIGSPYLFTRGSWALRLIGSAMLAVDRRLHLGTGALALKAWGEAVRLARVFIESPFFPSPIRGFHPGSMEPKILGQHMSLAMDSGSVPVLRAMFLSAAEARHTGDRMGWMTEFAAPFEALDAPLLVIAGTRDDLAPPESVIPAYERSRSRDKTYRTFPRGHIDLVVGKDAPRTVWPLIESWLLTRLRRREQVAA